MRSARTWRVAWHLDTPVTEFADFPKRRQAHAHAEAIRAKRGSRRGGELVYWVPLWRDGEAVA